MANKTGSRETAVRERLLAASLELFNSKGYSATSVREIVAASAVTKPVLYYYFGSKEGIYLELMHGAHATFQGIVSQIFAVQAGARERIVLFATGLIDGVVENLDLVRLIYSIYFGPAQGAPYFPNEEYFDAMLEIIGRLVEEGIEAGDFRPVDARMTAWVIASCMNTVIEEQFCRTPPRIDRDGLSRMICMILDEITHGGEK